MIVIINLVLYKICNVWNSLYDHTYFLKIILVLLPFGLNYTNAKVDKFARLNITVKLHNCEDRSCGDIICVIFLPPWHTIHYAQREKYPSKQHLKLPFARISYSKSVWIQENKLWTNQLHDAVLVWFNLSVILVSLLWLQLFFSLVKTV